MSIFSIHNNNKINNNVISTINKSFIGKFNPLSSKIESPNTIQAFEPIIKDKIAVSPTIPQAGVSVRSKQVFLPKSVTNDAKFITIRKDTTPIRLGGLYNYYTDRFMVPIEVDKFQFCSEQKISSVFCTTGHNQWFSTYLDRQPSFKTTLFDLVTPSPSILLQDCNCIHTDLSGTYTLDTKIFNKSNQLISSSNNQVSKGTIDISLVDNYIIIEIYSKITNSRARIKLRPPVRYRPAYNDWVFDENVSLKGLLSNTEFAEMIDCCDIIVNPLNKNG